MVYVRLYVLLIETERIIEKELNYAGNLFKWDR